MDHRISNYHNRGVVVVGATGFLGTTLAEEFKQAGKLAFSTTRRELDLEQPVGPQIGARLCELRPSALLMPAAITDVQQCFRDPSGSRRVNVQSMLELLDLCEELSIKPVFFSTDLVFDSLRDMYREDDPPQPTTEYGRQKAEIERAVRARFGDHLIFRTSKLMSMDRRPRNILMPIAAALEQGKVYRAFKDQWITPVFVEDAARAVRLALERGLTGTYHLAVPERMSRYELALRLARKMGRPETLIEPCLMMSSMPGGEPRGPYNTIESHAIVEATGVRWTPIDQGIEKLLARA